MFREAIEILSNWRFWSFLLVGFSFMWAGIISLTVVGVKEKYDEILQRKAEEEQNKRSHKRNDETRKTDSGRSRVSHRN